MKSLRKCPIGDNNEHKNLSNVVVEQFPDENYEPTPEPKTKSYLSTGYKDPEIEKKIKTIMELVKNLNINNPAINRLYKKARSKHPSLRK